MLLLNCFQRSFYFAGKSLDDVAAAARRLRMSAQVIAVGIRGAVRSELEEIATQSSPIDHVFVVEQFADLASFQPEISQAICYAGRSNDSN